MASPYHQGGGGHGPPMGGGGPGGGSMGSGGSGMGGYPPVPQMHPGAMSLEGHNGINSEHQDQDGNPQVREDITQFYGNQVMIRSDPSSVIIG